MLVRRRLVWAVGMGAFLSAFCMAAGCGAKSQPVVDTVSGTVHFNDKVVNYGAVAFIGENGRTAKALIMTDGTYKVRNPPQGEVRVTVTTGKPPIPASAPGGPSGEPLKFDLIDIPANYSDPEKTDLRFEVTSGQQTFDIPLKSEAKSSKPEEPK